MELHYIGADHGLGAIPLPEGWPAEDHEEPDETVAAAKVASGHYEKAGTKHRLPRNAEAMSEEESGG